MRAFSVVLALGLLAAATNVADAQSGEFRALVFLLAPPRGVNVERVFVMAYLKRRRLLASRARASIPRARVVNASQQNVTRTSPRFFERSRRRDARSSSLRERDLSRTFNPVPSSSLLKPSSTLLSNSRARTAGAAWCDQQTAAPLFACVDDAAGSPSTACCEALCPTAGTVSVYNPTGPAWVAVLPFFEGACACTSTIYNYNTAWWDALYVQAKACKAATTHCTTATDVHYTNGAADGFTTCATTPTNSFQTTPANIKTLVVTNQPPWQHAPPAPPILSSDSLTTYTELVIDMVFENFAPTSTYYANTLKTDLATAFTQTGTLTVTTAMISLDLTTKGLSTTSNYETFVTVTISPPSGSSTFTQAQLDMLRNKVMAIQSQNLAFRDGTYGTAWTTSAYPSDWGTATQVKATSPITTAAQPTEPTTSTYTSTATGTAEKLGPAATGLPRINPIGGDTYDGGFDITDDDYMMSLIGQGIPGIAMGLVLIVIMILMLVVYILSRLFGATCCKCCNKAYKPRKFTKRDVKINRIAMFMFVIVIACGSFLVFAEGPVLIDNTSALTAALVKQTTALVTDAKTIQTTMNTASADASMSSVSVSSATSGLVTAAQAVEKEAQNMQDLIDKSLEPAGLYITIIAGAIFGLSITMWALGFFGLFRLMIFFTIFISLMLILSWIIFGLMAIVATLVDDVCWAFEQYLIDRTNSDLSDFIPCMAAADAVEASNAARAQVVTGANYINEIIDTYASTNEYVKYVCLPYAKISMATLCTGTTPFYAQDYTKFVCDAYTKNLLTKLTADADGVVYAYPEADCTAGYPTAMYTMGLSTFSTDAASIKCDFSSTSDPIHGLGICYAYRQIPSDIWTTYKASASAATGVKDIQTTLDNMLTCGFVDDALRAMGGPCDNMAAASYNLWVGFMLISMGYFMLWVGALVLISRLQYYNDYCRDSDVYSNKYYG